MKLCKDCKHMGEGRLPWGSGLPMCIHPAAPADPVYGRKDASCALMRSVNCLVTPACGPNGEWFEQAPPAPELTPHSVTLVEAARDRSFWDKAKGWFI